MSITRFKADGLVKDESSLPPAMRQPVTGTPTPIDTEKVTPKRIDDVSPNNSSNADTINVNEINRVQRAIPIPVSPSPNIEEMEPLSEDDTVVTDLKLDTISPADEVTPWNCQEIHGDDLLMKDVKDNTTISSTRPRGVTRNPIIAPRVDTKYLNKLAIMLCQLPDTINISDIISDVLTDKDKDELIALAPTDMKPRLIQILRINDLRQLGWDDLDMDELISDKYTADTRDKVKEEYTVVMRHVIDKLTTHELFLKHFIHKA